MGLSLRAFAKVVGVNFNSVLNWEHGRSKPKPAMVKKLQAVGSLDKRQVETILAGKQPTPEKTPDTANQETELSPRMIKSLREDLGLTKSEFAVRLGVSYNSVFNWENAETKPSPTMAEKIWAVGGPADS